MDSYQGESVAEVVYRMKKFELRIDHHCLDAEELLWHMRQLGIEHIDRFLVHWQLPHPSQGR
jgi:hypothetical protein